MHAWQRPVLHDCPFVRIKKRLARVAADLKIWSKATFGNAKMQFHIANEVILRLDMARENRQLTAAEFDLRKKLKTKVVGIAAIERARRRQASRICWLWAGDAYTRLFHVKMRSPRRKNFIHSITIRNRAATDHAEKEKVIHDHFVGALGQAAR